MGNRNRVILILCLTAGGTTVAPLPAQTVSFAAAPSFSAGTSPTSLTTGDFNGDQKPDIAVTNQHGVSVLINDGNGGFLPRADYSPTGYNNPQSIATANLDADSHLDLAYVNQGSGYVTILLNNGDGSFRLGSSYLAGTNPHQVVIADVNGDNKPDLVIVDMGAAPGTSGISVLLGNGDGTFQTAKFFAAGSVSLSVAVADFNHDSKMDLAVANSGSDNVSILLGNGNGTFQAAVNISLDKPGISVTPTAVAVADFDKDSKLDLAVATPNVKGYVVLLGQGNGTFQAPVYHTLDDPNFVNNYNVLLATDFNLDQKPDLVLANYSANHVTILLGDGDGIFSKSLSYAAGPAPTCVVLADFNGDNTPDLAVSNDQVDGAITLLTGTGGGAVKAPPIYRSAYTPQSLAIGDLNGDGAPDIVAASPSGGPGGVGAGVTMLGNQSSVFGKGNGTFQAPVTWTTTGATSVALGDFNGDGKLDLATTHPSPGSGNVSIWLGNGDGTFQSPHTYTAGTTPDTIAVADLNNDHILDLVVGNHNSNDVSVLIGAGDGTFYAPLNFATPAAGTPDSIAVTDFNGDGKPDIVAAISGINATSVALLLGNGDGTFQTAVPIPSGFHSSAEIRLASADFNGDGKFDVAVTDGATLSILLGNNTGAIPTPGLYSLTGAGAGVAGMPVIGDFNGDNKPDLAVSTRDGIQLLLGNGAGAFEYLTTYEPVLAGTLAVADLDGSGTPDIVAADSPQDSIPTDTVAVLLDSTIVNPVPLTINTSPTGFSFSVFYGFPPGGILDEFQTCSAAPCTYNATWGSFFQIYATPTVPGTGGIQYALDHFSDAGLSVPDCCGGIIHNVLYPATATTVTAYYRQQYQVTVVASPAAGGTVTPASGNYYDFGATVPINATANPNYAFSTWTGVQQTPSGPATTICPFASCPLPVYGPTTWTATFNFTAQRCDLNSDSQLTGADVASLLNQALGISPASADLDHDGSVRIADAQLLINAVRGAGSCPQ